ncbi:MAG TPA: putative quinol monooxygenase [Burkholderiales bacterium]|nr:putative quinol monooxygenase [Burkholderiales bacterium]
MNRYVITVDFMLQEGALPEFLALIVENAHRSRTVEPGCERFDVLVPKDSTNHVFLYEIYRDKAAFSEHLKAPHFLEFNAASTPLVKDKKIVEYSLEHPTDGRARG